jgi:hypothetical protein
VFRSQAISELTQGEDGYQAFYFARENFRTATESTLRLTGLPEPRTTVRTTGARLGR